MSVNGAGQSPAEIELDKFDSVSNRRYVGIRRRVSKTATDRKDLRVCKRGVPWAPDLGVTRQTAESSWSRRTGSCKRHSSDSSRLARRTRRPRHATNYEKGPRPASSMRFLIRQRLVDVQGRSIRGHWEWDLAKGSGNAHRESVEPQSCFVIIRRLMAGRSNENTNRCFVSTPKRSDLSVTRYEYIGPN